MFVNKGIFQLNIFWVA